MAGIYDELLPGLRRSVDGLVSHAETALWPERRSALTSFWRGVNDSALEDNEAITAALGIELPSDSDPAEVVFRIVLTAYLERLADPEITNPDQALLYRLSLDRDQQILAECWFEDHPDHLDAGT